MYRVVFGQAAYSFFNDIVAIVVTLLISFFLIKEKTKELGIHSKRIVFVAEKSDAHRGKIIKYIAATVEVLLMTVLSIIMVFFNGPFGDLVGTGLNYFGGMFAFPFLQLVCSLFILTNILKHLDMATLLLPMRLFFLKIACFFNGCCWGIPWEYGPYNHHYDHPGNQVPVQAIEALWALLIFVFLLIYRKKAKTGTLYPIYMILYSATRFCSEFFRNEENVVWIFKTYHLLCIAGVVIGVVLLLLVTRFGERINLFFDAQEEEMYAKLAQRAEAKAIKIAEAEAEEQERLEKVKIAREKAKARRKK